MTKIAELQDKGSVVAWSPHGEYADVIALGSKVRLKCLTENNGLLCPSVFFYEANDVGVTLFGGRRDAVTITP